MFNAINNFLDWIDPPSTGRPVALNGKTYVLSVFITCRGEEWRREDKMKIYRKQAEAEHWLQNVSSGYGRRISWERGQYGLDETIYFPPVSIGRTYKDYRRIQDEVLWKVGYDSPEHFEEWLMENTACDNWVLVIYTKQKQRCYGWSNFQNSRSVIPMAGACLVSQRNQKGLSNMRYLATIIAHEILHTFGAMDLYEERGVALSGTRARKARKRVPNSIMRTTHKKINRLSLDKLTAWLVGLTDKRENWFDEILVE